MPHFPQKVVGLAYKLSIKWGIFLGHPVFTECLKKWTFLGAIVGLAYKPEVVTPENII